MFSGGTRRKRFLCVMVCAMLFMGSISISVPVKADLDQTEQGMDLVFVLDVSGSMNSKDENKTALELTKMIVDLLGYSDNRVGFVAYNDAIAYSYPLTEADGSGAAKLKKYISTVKYSGETDIGLGLKTAVEMVTKDQTDSSRKKTVILLSDGKTDLSNSKTSRTVKDSENDMTEALSIAEDTDTTIFPIRLNDKFDTKADYLSQVAKSTNGESYLAFSPLELIDKIDDILSKYQIPRLENVTTVSGNADIQQVNIDIDNDYVKGLKVFVLSTGKLDHIGIVGSDADITYDDAKKYGILEISDMNSVSGNSLPFYFKGSKKSNILVYVQEFYSLTPVMDIEESVSRDDSKTLDLNFIDENTGSQVDDSDLISGIQFTCDLVNEEDETKKGLSFEKTSSGIQIENAVGELGNYKVEVTYTSKKISGFFESNLFSVVNKEAENLGETEKKICISKNSVSYSLAELFGSKYEKGSSYTILSSEGSCAEFEIDGGKLNGSINKAGTAVLKLEEEDSEHNLYDLTLKVKCQTFWQRYQVILVGAAILAVMLTALIISVISVLKNRKRKVKQRGTFEGSLIGYVVDLKSANDFPPLKWDLRTYPGTGVSVAVLFQDVGIRDKFMGADRIWFYPKKDAGIEILHNLNGSIFIGTKMVNKDTPVTVYSGEKIYISFEENGVEIELRYKV